MIGFLCVFFPPVIAVALTAKMRKENFRYEQYFAYYAIFAVIINTIMFWILAFRFGSGYHHVISSADVWTTSFSARYLTMSSVIGIVLARLTEIIRNLKSSVKEADEEDEEEESEEKKTDKDS